MEKSKTRSLLMKKAVSRAAALMDRTVGAEGAALIRSILIGICVAVVTFLLGMTTVYASTAPFGASFMLAISRYVPFSFGGLIASAFAGSHKIPVLMAGIIIFAIRTSISYHYYTRERRQAGKPDDTLYKEPVFVRVILSVFAAFLLGVVKLIGNSYRPEELVGMLLAMVLSPLTTWLFTGLNDESPTDSIPAKAGVYALMIGIVYALRGHTLLGFSLSIMLAMGLTIWMAEKGGVLLGGIGGVLTGMAAEMAYSPALALAGMVSGLVFPMHSALAVALGSFAAVGIGIATDGFHAFRTFAPDVVVAAALLVPFVQMRLFPPLPPSIRQQNATAEHRPKDYSEIILWKKQTEQRLHCMEALSAALGGLSEVCMTLSQRLRRPALHQAKRLVEEVFDSHCSQCAMKAICCRGSGDQPALIRENISRRLHKQNGVSMEDIPDTLQSGCRHLERILSEINGFYGEMLENNLRSDKTEIFALEYDAMAKILEETGKREHLDTVRDDELTEQIRVAAEYLHFPCDSIAVFGQRRKTILAGGVRLTKLSKSADELHRVFENVCGVPLSLPQFAMDDDYVTMTMMAELQYSASFCSSVSQKPGETVNGDQILAFTAANGYQYYLISDGMGSGYEAAITSKMCGIFLEKLLSAGCSVSLSLEMLNNFIRNRNVECFATVDLLQIDQLSGESLFIKSGAAPSYILREGSLFKVASNTMPIGITREMNAEEIKFTLQHDDVVIMTSDGVAQSFDDSIWLTELICTQWEDDLQIMAEKIREQAEQRNLHRDDITVGVIRVNACSRETAAKNVSHETLLLTE